MSLTTTPTYNPVYATNPGTLWNFDDAKKTISVDKSANIKSRLGVTMKLIQDQNKISAIAAPVDFIKKRSAEIEGWFDPTVTTTKPKGAVIQFYDTIYDDYLRLGFTEEQCAENASRAAQIMYQQKLSILDASNPGAYDMSYNTVGLQHNQEVASASLTEAAIIRKYKEGKMQAKLKQQ